MATMPTNSIVAHGIALDTARLKGQVVYTWRQILNEATVDIGMAIGENGRKEIPPEADMYARYVPHEVVKHMIKLSMVIPWEHIARACALRDSCEHHESQCVWRLSDGNYFTCHPSINIDGAKRLEVYFVA